MLLEVHSLSIKFKTATGPLEAVQSLSFSIDAGETLGVVGESGCGKSVANMALMGLLPEQALVHAERMEFAGKSLLDLSEKQWQQIRGRSIAMIFQDPMSSLNPCFTIQRQIEEALACHFPGLSKKDRLVRVTRLLEQVGIPDVPNRLRSYPHELSGGMAQRIMIAMALACEPSLLIADEPTTALDVTIQDQILKLLMALRKERGMALILVTHDLAVAAQNSDRIQVMYAGEIVESGKTRDLLSAPVHPYTEGLLNSLPSENKVGFRSRLKGIEGSLPSLANRPKGCQFFDRCPKAQPRCSREHPPLERSSRNPERLIRCFFPGRAA